MKHRLEYEKTLRRSIKVLDVEYRKNDEPVTRESRLILTVVRWTTFGKFNEPWLICQLRYFVEPLPGFSSSEAWATVWGESVEHLEGLAAEEMLERYPVDRRLLEKSGLCEVSDKTLSRIRADLQRGLKTWQKWFSDQKTNEEKEN